MGSLMMRRSICTFVLCFCSLVTGCDAESNLDNECSTCDLQDDIECAVEVADDEFHRGVVANLEHERFFVLYDFLVECANGSQLAELGYMEIGDSGETPESRERRCEGKAGRWCLLVGSPNQRYVWRDYNTQRVSRLSVSVDLLLTSDPEQVPVWFNLVCPKGSEPSTELDDAGWKRGARLGAQHSWFADLERGEALAEKLVDGGLSAGGQMMVDSLCVQSAEP